MPPSAPRLERMRPEQANRLWDDIAALKRDDPLAPVTVVGPSMYANLSLRQELAARGFANVRFAILSQVSELLGAPRVVAERPEIRPLKPVIEAAAIRTALKRAGADSRLADFADNPGAIRSLRATFRELRAAPDSSLDALAEIGELRADAVSIYRRFARLTEDGFYDSESLARAAADAVADGSAPVLKELGFIIFYRVGAMSAGEIRLVRALSAAGKAAIALGIAGDEEADAPIKALARRLSDSPADAVGDADAPAAASADNTHLLIAPTPREEVRWVIRRIAEHAERGTPFHKIAILYRKASPYSSLIREELELAGLPVAGPDALPLSRAAVGRALIGLVNLAGGDFARDDVMSWLTGCPVKPSGVSARRFVPSLWDAVSKRAGVTRGVEQWGRRLSLYAKGLERQINANTDDSAISAARAAGMSAEARAARDLAAFVKTLSDSVKPPPDGSAWETFRKWAWDAFEKFSASRLDIPESEVSALDKIEMRMNELATAQAIDPSPTFEGFRQALNEALSSSAGRLGKTGEGVFVAQFANAAAMRFDAVYFVGMIEGAAPPALRESPLMPDEDRRAAGGADAGLPLLSERRARERYDFLAAMATAPHRTLSYPVADPVGGRENHPSRWMLERASALNGARVAASDLASLDETAWLTVVKSPETALQSVAEFAPADIHDYDLERIRRWTKGGLSARRHPIAESGALAIAFDMGRMRNSKRLTEWDGDLSSARPLPQKPKPYAPSGLERWASCPFSYFLSYGLRIAALDKPEDEYFLSPLERGSLVHAILEKFVNRMRESGGIPKPSAAWGDDSRETLLAIAAQEFARTEREGFSGKALSWRLEKDEIAADLDAFLAWDSELRERFGMSPFMAEARFGMAGDSHKIQVDVDGETVRLRGVVDRIDTGEGGASALVMDYKTGSANPYNILDKDPLDNGRKLQLAIYSLAAKKIVGRDDARALAAYAFVSARGGFQLRPKEPIDYGADEIDARFRFVTGEIVDGIRNGVFPANPGEMGYGGYENCRFCDFDSLCPSRRDVMWRRKKEDPKAARYASMVEAEQGV